MGRIIFGVGSVETGAVGAFTYQTRSTDSLSAVFTSTALRDTYYTANPTDLAALDDDRSLAVGIGTIDGDSASVTVVYTRRDGQWVTAPSVLQGDKGAQGPTGPAGTDGVRRMFNSVSARNAFYGTQTNRDDLNTDDVISVNVGGNTVEFQQWLGGNAPTDYDENNFVPVSLRTSNASINFADELRIFDYGEIPAFEDMINNVTALAIGQRFTNAGGSQGARQLNFPAVSTLLTVPEGADSALQQVHTYTFDTTGIITNPAIVVEATINFLTAPNFYIAEIFQGTDDTGTRIFRGRFEPNGVAGLFTATPDSPQRFLPNTTYFFRLTGDIAFQYRTPTGLASPAGTSDGFEFTFQDLATQNFVRDTLAGLDNAVALTASTTINSGNQATYERKLLYTGAAVSANINITIDPGLTFDGFALYPFGSGSVSIVGGAGVTIDGQASETFNTRESVRVFPSPENGDDYATLHSNNRLSTEAIQDIVGGMVTGNTETGITVTYDDTNGKLDFVIGTPAGSAETFYHLLSDSNNPDTVDVSSPAQGESQSVGTGSGQQFTFSIGPATLNDWLILLVPTDHDINRLVNTDSGFTLIPGTTFTRTADVRQISSVNYTSYVLGPLVAGFTANYQATLA